MLVLVDADNVLLNYTVKAMQAIVAGKVGLMTKLAHLVYAA
jgi:hypothetical protein